MIYLFALDDSLTSQRFTTKIKQLTKLCEPLQKMGVKLSACKTGFSSQQFYIIDRSKAIFCCGPICLCFGLEFSCCVYVFILLFMFG